jgi:4-hydroxy-2-oxoheptanedioate aldolase
MLRDRLGESLSEDRSALGLIIADVQMVELAAYLGFDWFMIDQMFTGNDWSKTLELVRAGEAYGITPTIRIQSNPWSGYDHRLAVDVSRALGIGCQYIFVSPSCKKEIEECAATSHSWHRRGTTIHRFNDYEEWEPGTRDMVEGTYITPTLESADTLENWEEILDIPEVKILFFAMTDASKVLTDAEEGKPDWYNERLWQMLDEAVAKSKAAGKFIGANTSYAYTMDEIGRRVVRLNEHGVKVILLQAALFLYQVAVGNFLKELKTELT